MFTAPLNYEAPVYRPPSEWKSLLIQVTIGCSNNKCTYCDMYRSKTYRERSFEEIEQDLYEAKRYYDRLGRDPEKVFLCDGDALGAPTELLEKTLHALHRLFPDLRRVGIYATAENILEKSEEDLIKLSKLKLSIAYLGLESGDDRILHMLVKGNTAADMVEASLKVKRCGFQLSTIIMLGVGGKKHSSNHIMNTAKVLSQTSPHFLSFLTTFAVEGTPYDKMVNRGLIEPLTSFELFEELHNILEQSTFQDNSVLFRANHVSNMHPIGGTLPKDQKMILATLKEWMAQTPRDTYPPRPASM